MTAIKFRCRKLAWQFTNGTTSTQPGWFVHCTRRRWHFGDCRWSNGRSGDDA